MLSHFRRLLIGACAVAIVSSAPLFAAPAAAPAKAADPKAAPKPKESATEPKPRDDRWVKRHEGFLAEVKAAQGNVDLLFVGDSITDGWRGGGKKVWAENWTPLKALNLGIGGDRTQHVLWRLQNGEMQGIKPKAAVLMIGTNNLSSNTDDEIAAGITLIVKEIQKQSPTTKVLLLGIFPRGEKADNPARARIKNINSIVCKLDDGGKTVKYLDIGSKFVDKDNNLPKEIMPDFLHLSEKGYQIEADAIRDSIKELMK